MAHAPLGVLVMVAEMLGDASLLGPGVLAVLCARAVTGGVTLYRSQLDRLADGPGGPPEPRHPVRAKVPDRRTVVSLVRGDARPHGPVPVKSTDTVAD
ncbi:hypothetical protein JCM4814A_45010 [Streptomyces phaeofaciens JCM 4814]|uniref:Uncharacterized protein n=1 Tax=Streptomyces phaeofaciens TaxID=68254 RepID=A0A918H0H6_9ACTN|nr:hypothetical protein [Streptomyces phaeofaciens]GGT29545.1 hypothetical protein GCM10010226_01690 [Streptomyces phaeofaciens]